MATKQNTNQLRELSDEELKQVTGGKSRFISVNSSGLAGVGDSSLSIELCLDSEKDENGKCIENVELSPKGLRPRYGK